MLSGRTGIVAPKTFKVDCADIAASTLGSKNSVDLFEILKSELIVDIVAAPQPTRLDVILACG